MAFPSASWIDFADIMEMCLGYQLGMFGGVGRKAIDG